MPTLAINEAIDKLAKAVENARPSVLVEIYSELYPERPGSDSPIAADLARHVRNGLAPEEAVDLWNVVFPEDYHVRYDEETKSIHHNEEMAGLTD